jgi:multidrug transporter EmrE-like cation transporter
MVLAGGIILTIGDLIQRQWVESGKTWQFVLGLFVWFCGSIFLALSFKHKNIVVASLLYIIFNVITLTLITWLVYGDKLSVKQMIGVALGLLAVFFLE